MAIVYRSSGLDSGRTMESDAFHVHYRRGEGMQVHTHWSIDHGSTNWSTPTCLPVLYIDTSEKSWHRRFRLGLHAGARRSGCAAIAHLLALTIPFLTFVGASL